MPNKVHEGRNVKRIREIMGVKQEALADKLGMQQQKISLLEQREVIDPDLLEDVAKALGINSEAIRNFNEEATIFNIQNNYEGANKGVTQVSAQVNNHDCTFNPIEKWIEALEENKKLYEALLKSEREKVAMLERLLAKQ